ncbi:Putative fatty acyl-CoA reductase CG5065 [Geodia barretti]|uniref:Fatty acyl-CoA reductase n=1 Tax=Geodia barretti TaxID=519541 RepID=A0AA35SFX7_GEOBA|nr:Putative fatty acyl-CoA reductase CG5065 [Geodia barretti]
MAAEVVITDGSENMLPSIVDFYSARDVFITGATGFMGKCLLEKLLRSVPDLGSVFVLTRAKKGKSPEQRTKELLSSPLFERLRSEQPGAVDKVVPVFGDIQEKQLGMRREDQEMLQDRVSIVFHLAATVRFESPLREALTKNVASVSELITLCHGMKHLKSMVHVSSAYSQCNRTGVIDEVHYQTPLPPSKLLGLLDWMTDEQLETLAPTLSSGYPNTYTFTKALAEQVIMDEAKVCQYPSTDLPSLEPVSTNLWRVGWMFFMGPLVSSLRWARDSSGWCGATSSERLTLCRSISSTTSSLPLAGSPEQAPPPLPSSTTIPPARSTP